MSDMPTAAYITSTGFLKYLNDTGNKFDPGAHHWKELVMRDDANAAIASAIENCAEHWVPMIFESAKLRQQLKEALAQIERLEAS